MNPMKLSEQAMISLLFLFQRSLFAAASGEEENFHERAKVLNFVTGENGELYCLNPPGVPAVDATKFETTFEDLEDE